MPFHWPRLVPLDAVAVALYGLAMVLTLILPLPISLLPAGACLVGTFILLGRAKR